jgi:hypothetical protein
MHQCVMNRPFNCQKSPLSAIKWFAELLIPSRAPQAAGREIQFGGRANSKEWILDQEKIKPLETFQIN